MKNKVGYIILLTVFCTISACLLIHSRTDAHRIDALQQKIITIQESRIGDLLERIDLCEEPETLPMFRDGEEE